MGSKTSPRANPIASRPCGKPSNNTGRIPARDAAMGPEKDGSPQGLPTSYGVSSGLCTPSPGRRMTCV